MTNYITSYCGCSSAVIELSEYNGTTYMTFYLLKPHDWKLTALKYLFGKTDGIFLNEPHFYESNDLKTVAKLLGEPEVVVMPNGDRHKVFNKFSEDVSIVMEDFENELIVFSVRPKSRTFFKRVKYVVNYIFNNNVNKFFEIKLK